MATQILWMFENCNQEDRLDLKLYSQRSFRRIVTYLKYLKAKAEKFNFLNIIAHIILYLFSYRLIIHCIKI